MWGIKEGTVVDDIILYNCLLRVFVRGGGSTYFNLGPEHVLEGNPESSHPSYDDKNLYESTAPTTSRWLSRFVLGEIGEW